MAVSYRRPISSLGTLLLPAGLTALGLAACGGSDRISMDPARSFVETPSGRRMAVTAAPSSSSSDVLAVSREALSVPADPFVIAKFAGPITPEARRDLARAGYREVTYLPYDALLLERPRDAAPLTVAGMVAIGSYLPEDRIARELTPEGIAALGEPVAVPVMIHVMPGRDRAAVRAVAAAEGGEIAGEGEAGGFGRISVIFPTDKVAEAARSLAQASEVFLVERIHHAGFFNDKSAGTIQSGVQGHDAGQTPIWNHGIRGEGQIAGMADTGLDANSCYFNGDALPVTNTWTDGVGYGTKTDPSHRKIIAYDFLYSCDQWPGASKCETPDVLTDWDTYGHGTHVAGNILGDSDNDPKTYAGEDGMAPAAKIVVQDAGFLTNMCSDGPGFGCPVMKLDGLFEQARVQGVNVHNNSWGDNEKAMPATLQCNYSARSQDVDRYMWEHRDFLIVYAAGNQGRGSLDFSVGSPSTNKNGLSIGSVRTSVTATSDDNISSFSSRGWTSDGRIKPDIMFPGCNASAGNDKNVGGAVNCTTDSGCGTSYATPTAVGAALLVRQYFTDGFYPTGEKIAANAMTPSAALIKATMISSAVSLKGTDNGGSAISPIPSNEQGWGRAQLDQALLFAGSPRKLLVDDHRAGMPAGATAPLTYTLQGVDAGQPLKITLAWTDYPGTPDSPPAAGKVDDPTTWNAARLVNDLDLQVTGPDGNYLGNVFTDGVSAMGGTADQRNNVEQVLLPAPTAGSYTITVQPKTIMEGPQDFALVVTGAWSGTTSPPVGEGGTEGGAAGDGAAGAGGASTTPPPDDKSGCSCNLSGPRVARAPFAWLALTAFPVAMLRLGVRRRRRGLRRDSRG